MKIDIDYDKIRNDWIHYSKSYDDRFYKFMNISDNKKVFRINHKEIFHQMFNPFNEEMLSDEMYDALFGIWLAFLSVEYELLEKSLPLLNKLKEFMGDE
tara:strand:+ start:122 stop:418 length:297 start_codon:yes stop_codon:yes gene_type:complete